MAQQSVAALVNYSLLGRSGLRVSPLCLGTMTFGTEWGWGSPRETAFALLDEYLGAGGNFVDTADLYTRGTSERILGEYFQQNGSRDRVVLATKFTFGTQAGDPNTGGNGRKNIYQALHGSLARLQTDYVDMYWLHAWDGLTPVDEVVNTLDDLVHQGKIRYWGLSDVPAWYAARAQTLGELRGRSQPIALQLEYSLIERNIEREHIPAARALGMGLCPWSPLGGGILTGKYRRESGRVHGEGRLPAIQAAGHPMAAKLAEESNWRIADEVVQLARRLERSPAQVALNWITKRPGVVSTIIGATKLDQLRDNLRALDFDLPRDIAARLEEISRPELVHPYVFFQPPMRAMLTGGTNVSERPAWDR